MRTDAHNNPTAFTTDIAKEAKLIEGKDYVQGDSFSVGGHVFYTAKLLGDPIAITRGVIDTIGFRTSNNAQRWTYISLPKFVWATMTLDEKRDVIGFMYMEEGGTTMRGLFPNYFLK